MSENVKPPIGLRPEWIVQYHNNRDRLLEISEAIIRYSGHNLPIPSEWALELYRRIEQYLPRGKE